MWKVDSMTLKVLAVCPFCNYPNEATGSWLSAFSLSTTEGWVIECFNCKHVFLHSVSDKDNDDKQLQMTKYHEDVEECLK